MLKKAEGWLTGAERGLLVALLAFMVALAFLQVVLRGVFSTGILWGDTLLRHLVLWVGFLGAALAASSDKQFALDLSARLFSGRLKASIALLRHAFTAGVCWFLLRAALTFFHQEYAQHTPLFVVGRFEAQAWLFELVLPGGFGLLFVHYVLKSVEAVGELAGGKAK